MIVISNPNQFADFKQEAVRDLVQELIEVQKQHLRKSFDDARLDSTAEACIELAKRVGFDELAEEMESDLITERIMAVMTNH